MSVSMFALAVVGNATYLGSILARSTRWVTIAPNMPWIVDAAMCLVMDAVILAQSAWYGGCGGCFGCFGKSRAAGSTHARADSGYASDDESRERRVPARPGVNDDSAPASSAASFDVKDPFCYA